FVPETEDEQRSLGLKNFTLLSEGTTIVAEDLGVIPRFVKDVLAQLGLPGYQVMRWTREDGVYRDPRYFPESSLVTSGTHDTQTLREWWESAERHEREAVARGWPELAALPQPLPEAWSFPVQEALLRAVLNAHSSHCILLWQDLF